MGKGTVESSVHEFLHSLYIKMVQDACSGTRGGNALFECNAGMTRLVSTVTRSPGYKQEIFLSSSYLVLRSL